MAAIATVAATAPQAPSRGCRPRPRIASSRAGSIAFLAMVFGMFMAILDIQIVSASLTEIQAGLAGLRQRDHLGADRLPDRRGGDDPAVGLPVARARHAHPVRHLGGRLHGREPDVRALHHHQRDDRLAGRPGLHRRRHDPDRVRHRLHHLPALAHEPRHADDRPGRDAGADHRPDGRRLSDRCALLALAVLHQHRARASP